MRALLSVFLFARLVFSRADDQAVETCNAGVRLPTLIVWTRLDCVPTIWEASRTSSVRLVEAARWPMDFQMPGWNSQRQSADKPFHFTLSPEDQKALVEKLMRLSVRAKPPHKALYFNHRHYIDVGRFVPQREAARVAYVTLLRQPFAQLRSDFYWQQAMGGCSRLDLSSDRPLCNHTLSSYVEAHGVAHVMDGFRTSALRFLCAADDQPDGEPLAACALRRLNTSYAAVCEAPRSDDHPAGHTTPSAAMATFCWPCRPASQLVGMSTRVITVAD